MNSRIRLTKAVVLTAVLTATISILFTSTNYAYDWWPFGKKTESSEVPVTIDPNPIAMETKKSTSIAPMIKKVAPSVVNVFSTKIHRGTDQLQHMPFFNDPFFRHFFGDQYQSNPKWKPESRKEQSLGSGVIVSSDGYILTNNHVVEGADQVKIALAGNKIEYKAEVVGADPKTDIAVLKVDAKDLPAVTFTDSDVIEVGDFVVAIGNPFGVGQTVTSGIISALGRGNIGITDYEDFIQTDASINPGNSGGALVDAEGRLIGINTAILSRSGGNQGIGFAVPINLAKSVMERILNHGRVVRGFLGVLIQDVTPELSQAFNLPANQGALVGEVTSDSAAEEAGIKKGDVILSFNGKKVEDVRHLRLMVARTQPDTKVKVDLIRDGEELELEVNLKELPGSEMASGKLKAQDQDTSGLLMGIIVDDLNPRTRQQLGVPDKVSGAVVSEIKPDSPAYDAGLRQGDIILEINRVQVRNESEAIKASRKINEDSVLLYVWGRGNGRYIVVKDLDQN